MAYKLEFADEAAPRTSSSRATASRCWSTPKSLPYLDGMELDYAREGLNEGFKFNNPNVKDQCGCGELQRLMDPDFSQDHFALFGLANRAFRLDDLAISIPVTAPFRPGASGPHAMPARSERRLSMQWATQANEAYLTLKSRCCGPTCCSCRAMTRRKQHGDAAGVPDGADGMARGGDGSAPGRRSPRAGASCSASAAGLTYQLAL
jgi:hypothetical protein